MVLDEYPKLTTDKRHYQKQLTFLQSGLREVKLNLVIISQRDCLELFKEVYLKI